MSDFRIGDEVLAPWLNDGFLYPAILVAIDGHAAHVAYLDGDESNVAVSTLRHGTLGPGMHLQVNWKGKGTYYGGTIQARVGVALQMAYDDGDRGWATVAQCRIPAAALAAISPRAVACTYCGSALDISMTSCGHCGAPRPGR